MNIPRFDEISLYDVANKTKEKRLEAENKKKQKLLAKKKAEERGMSANTTKKEN